MSIPRRHASIPGTYFVTSRTWESRQLFVSEPMCRTFIECLMKYRRDGVYSLHAYVLMTDHFHVLITPAQDITLEKAIQFIKGGSARRLGIQLNMKCPVWQKGFSDHRIRNTFDFANHVNYIDQNPVKKKLSVQATDYLWSSSANVAALDDPPQGLKPREEERVARYA